MRGEILSYDPISGQGLITGADFLAYQFVAADIVSGQPRDGQPVDFAAQAEGRATRIVVMGTVSEEMALGRFDLGRVIRRTFDAIGRNWAVMFGSAILFIGLPGAVVTFGPVGLAVSSQFLIMLLGLLGSVVHLAGVYVVQGVVMKAAINGFNGASTRLSEAFAVGRQMFLPLLGLAILAGIATAIGFVLLLVPGIMLCVVWSVAAPALVTEGCYVTQSLERSRNLTRGCRWPIFGLLVIYWVLTAVIGIAAEAIARIGDDISGFEAVFAFIAGPVVSVVSGVLAAAGAASLYYELRLIKEGSGSDELASVFD